MESGSPYLLEARRLPLGLAELDSNLTERIISAGAHGEIIVVWLLLCRTPFTLQNCTDLIRMAVANHQIELLWWFIERSATHTSPRIGRDYYPNELVEWIVTHRCRHRRRLV
jgi:hypothetical protein